MDVSEQVAHIAQIATSLLGPMSSTKRFSEPQIANAVLVARMIVAESTAQVTQEVAQAKAKGGL